MGGSSHERGAPRAVIRLSGAQSFAAIAAMLHPDRLQTEVRAALAEGDRRCVLSARLALPSVALAGIKPNIVGRAPIELPIGLALMPGPRSPTGEHCAEIHLPASPALIERVIGALCATSDTGPGRVRPAGPGEFTARAFLHGRLTLEEAEGIGALIGARDQAQRLAALRLLSGETGSAYREVTDELATLLALVEAGIDFTDQEDVVPIERGVLGDRVRALVDRLDALGADPRATPQRLPLVVLAGRPSAGKSTLFNALLGRERAIVDDAPGTTRDALRETLDLGDERLAGGAVTLVDAPGLDGALAELGVVGDKIGTGGASVSDLAAQRGALNILQQADVVLLCDERAEFSFWASLIAPGGALQGACIPTLRVRTKADRALEVTHESGVVSVCALDGRNLAALRGEIAQVACGAAHRADDHAAVSPRHALALRAARQALGDAEHAISDSPASSRAVPRPELVAGRLREALDAMGELVGAISPDEIIGRIFARFCIGK